MIAPSDSDLADQTQARLSVLFTLVYDSGINAYGNAIPLR